MTGTHTPIVEQVAAMHAGQAGALPEFAAQAFGDEQRHLAAAGIPVGVAEPGTTVPDGDLLDVSGEPTSLAAARAGRPAVIVFYRGAWCPYCNLTLQAYQDQLAEPLAERGMELIAISPQKPDGSLTMQQRHALSYRVLSDPGNQIASQLGILTGPSDVVKDVQDQLGLDLAALNADGTYALPMPTTLVVAADGTIRWIDVHPNYSTRSEPADILAAVDLVTS